MLWRCDISKLEANFSLIVITFFSSLQYIFLAGVPSYIPNSSFVCITSFIGFILLFFIFFNELFRLDKKHIFQSMLLASELFLFNYFLLLGSIGLDAVTISCVISAYFVFIPIIEFIVFKSIPKQSKVISILLVLVGILFIMNWELKNLYNRNVLYLLIADISMAAYVISTGYFSNRSNPAILSMGQLLFIGIVSFISWNIEVRTKGMKLTLPLEPSFWGSVVFISFFIRCLYTVIQTYAQRFVSALNTSLIFSTEIIITMLTSSSISHFFGMRVSDSNINLNSGIGAVLMLCGIFVSDPSILQLFTLKKRKQDV